MKLKSGVPSTSLQTFILGLSFIFKIPGGLKSKTKTPLKSQVKVGVIIFGEVKLTLLTTPACAAKFPYIIQGLHIIQTYLYYLFLKVTLLHIFQQWLINRAYFQLLKMEMV